MKHTMHKRIHKSLTANIEKYTKGYYSSHSIYSARCLHSFLTLCLWVAVLSFTTQDIYAKQKAPARNPSTDPAAGTTSSVNSSANAAGTQAQADAEANKSEVDTNVGAKLQGVLNMDQAAIDAAVNDATNSNAGNLPMYDPRFETDMIAGAASATTLAAAENSIHMSYLQDKMADLLQRKKIFDDRYRSAKMPGAAYKQEMKSLQLRIFSTLAQGVRNSDLSDANKDRLLGVRKEIVASDTAASSGSVVYVNPYPEDTLNYYLEDNTRGILVKDSKMGEMMVNVLAQVESGDAVANMSGSKAIEYLQGDDYKKSKGVNLSGVPIPPSSN